LLHDRAFPPAWKGFWACKCAVPYLPSTSAFRETARSYPRIIQNLWYRPYSLTLGIGNPSWGLPVNKP
jgi:hypothetical protein